MRSQLNGEVLTKESFNEMVKYIRDKPLKPDDVIIRKGDNSYWVRYHIDGNYNITSTETLIKKGDKVNERSK